MTLGKRTMSPRAGAGPAPDARRVGAASAVFVELAAVEADWEQSEGSRSLLFRVGGGLAALGALFVAPIAWGLPWDDDAEAAGAVVGDDSATATGTGVNTATATATNPNTNDGTATGTA